MNKPDVLKELKKVLEFYQLLGFQHVPVKQGKIVTHSVKAPVENKEVSGFGELRVAEDPGTAARQKEALLKALREEIGDCQRCKLAKGRKNIVFGEGNADAMLMFIGEGPGREEDLQARPFVGDAGKVLTNLIKKMGLERDDVYIANIVKCRPPMNRDPESDEIETCIPFLEKQIEIIQPRIIMALGRIAAQRLIESSIPISKMRGRFYDYKGIPVMPTFHPAYLIRNPKDKWLTWDDAQKVLEKLKEKQ
jgi:DNA polymerase